MCYAGAASLPGALILAETGGAVSALTPREHTVLVNEHNVSP